MKLSNGRTLDFGIYVNADDIARDLQNKKIRFQKFKIQLDHPEFIDIVTKSGLINRKFTRKRFESCIQVSDDALSINHSVARKKNDLPYDRIAQILAYYLRNKLLLNGVKFTFETVFSHPGKIEFMKRARDKGYKVYLYFVSTEHPKINVYRVKKVRVLQGGHDVDDEKIVARYYRTMDQLYEACQYCYRTYFFDNSSDGNEENLFAYFQTVGENNRKKWNSIDRDKVPKWFIKYYSEKIT
ncbi:MAG: hypothetical protein LC664_13380 [Flavobacteriales bacterium]|nr:hypothetical protein [Flavobacteriales bacterium]